jgi:hypothetical protein
LKSVLATSGGVSGALRLFLSDVLGGLRLVSHNALAMLGLVAVAVALFLFHRPEVRHELEGRALSWLVERANVRLVNANEGEADDGAALAELAEPEAIQRATAANPAELNRQQAAVAYWIARRYNVAPEPISRLVQEAWSVGQRMGVEPTLVLAVMAVESGFNPFAQSHVGAQGLMQVMTGVHHDKYAIFGGKNAAFDPVTNLRVGVQVLKDCIRRAGSLEGGLKYYVGAANLADDRGYGAKVLAEQTYLRQVANGRSVPVMAPLPQATVQAATPAASPSVTVVPTAAPAGASGVAPAASEIPAVPHRPEQVALLVH